MSNESYSLILNSQNAINRDGTNINSYRYFINWSSVLPKKYGSFNVSFSLKSVNVTTNLSVTALVNIDFGQTNNFDQTSNQSKFIGIVYPVAVEQASTIWNYYYNSTLNENQPITISYPTNNFITVQFRNIDLTTAFTMFHYVLQLTVTPILQISDKEQIFLNSI